MICRSNDIRRALRSRQRGFLLNPFRFGAAPPATDPDFASVVLGLEMEGADASTTFTDFSSVGHTVSAVGDAQLDTAVAPPYGASAGLFDGTGDYLSVPDHASLDFGTGDFTVEGWVYVSNLGTAPFIWHKFGAGSGSSNGWFIEVDATHIYAGKGVNTSLTDFAPFPCALSANTWYYIALTRTGGTIEVYLGGGSLGTFTPGGAVLAGNFDNGSPMILGGGGGSFFTTLMLNGRMKDWRVSTVRRYTADFTAPAAPHAHS